MSESELAVLKLIVAEITCTSLMAGQRLFERKLYRASNRDSDVAGAGGRALRSLGEKGLIEQHGRNGKREILWRLTVGGLKEWERLFPQWQPPSAPEFGK